MGDQGNRTTNVVNLYTAIGVNLKLIKGGFVKR